MPSHIQSIRQYIFLFPSFSASPRIPSFSLYSLSKLTRMPIFWTRFSRGSVSFPSLSQCFDFCSFLLCEDSFLFCFSSFSCFDLDALFFDGVYGRGKRKYNVGFMLLWFFLSFAEQLGFRAFFLSFFLFFDK